MVASAARSSCGERGILLRTASAAEMALPLVLAAPGVVAQAFAFRVALHRYAANSEFPPASGTLAARAGEALRATPGTSRLQQQPHAAPARAFFALRHQERHSMGRRGPGVSPKAEA